MRLICALVAIARRCPPYIACVCTPSIQIAGGASTSQRANPVAGSASVSSRGRPAGSGNASVMRRGMLLPAKS